MAFPTLPFLGVWGFLFFLPSCFRGYCHLSFMFLKGQGGKHRDALGGHRPPSAPTKGKLLGEWAAPSPLPLTVPLPPDMPWCPRHPAPRSGCPSSLQNPSLAPYHPPCKSPSPRPDKNSFWSPNGLSSCDFPAMASSLEPQEGHLVFEFTRTFPLFPEPLLPILPPPGPVFPELSSRLPHFPGAPCSHQGQSTRVLSELPCARAWLSTPTGQAGRTDGCIREHQGLARGPAEGHPGQPISHKGWGGC